MSGAFQQPSEPGAAGWGGAPVKVGSHLDRMRPVAAPAAGFAELGPQRADFGVTDLMSLQGRSRKTAVSALLRGGLSDAAGKTVLLASVFGGAGVSTLTVQLWSTWAARSVDAVLLDPSGQMLPGLAARIPADSLVGEPRWADFADGRPLSADFAAARGSVTGQSLLIHNRTQFQPAVAPVLVRNVATAAALSWPLTMVDGSGSDLSRLEELVLQTRPDLLVLVCRTDVSEIRATAAFLRHLHVLRMLDCQTRAVIACAGDRHTSHTAQALAATADVAAGSVALKLHADLIDRQEVVRTGSRAAPGLELLAAAVAQVNRTIKERQHG